MRRRRTEITVEIHQTITVRRIRSTNERHGHGMSSSDLVNSVKTAAERAPIPDAIFQLTNTLWSDDPGDENNNGETWIS